MSRMSISKDDPRIGSLITVAKLVLKEPIKEAVKEALEEQQQGATASKPGTSSGKSGSSGKSPISGRSAIVGLALVGGAAYLASRRGWMPGGKPQGIDVGGLAESETGQETQGGQGSDQDGQDGDQDEEETGAAETGAV